MCNFKSNVDKKPETPKIASPFWYGVRAAPSPNVLPPEINLPVSAKPKPAYIEPDMRGTVFTK